MRRTAAIVAGVILAALVTASPVVADEPDQPTGSAPIVNDSYHFTDMLAEFYGDDPCTGEPLFVSELETGSAHEMMLADGRVAITGGFRADFQADTNGDSEFDIAGRYTLRYTVNGWFDPVTGGFTGKARSTFSWNGEYWGLGGGPTTRFHQTMHLLGDAYGDVKHGLFKARCW